jgi:large subunit ribosomal protein L13
MPMIVIDATDTQLGRLASYVAKQLLNGEEVVIINPEKAIISGRKEVIFEKYKTRWEFTNKAKPIKRPKYGRTSYSIVYRAIRGMIPRRKAKGREALRRLKIELEPSEELISKAIRLETKKPLRYVYVEDVVKFLGGKY